MYYDIVFHFDKGVEELNVVVSNVTNYYNGLENEVFSAVLVVNGPGIEFMGQIFMPNTPYIVRTV